MQGLEWCIYMLKNAKDCQQTPQARRSKEKNLYMLSGAYPATLYSGELLAWRLVKQHIYVQSHPVCGEGEKEGRKESTNQSLGHWTLQWKYIFNAITDEAQNS